MCAYAKRVSGSILFDQAKDVECSCSVPVDADTSMVYFLFFFFPFKDTYARFERKPLSTFKVDDSPLP